MKLQISYYGCVKISQESLLRRKKAGILAQRGYYANTAGKNAIKIVERVEHQMKKGRAGEPPTMLK